jgi:hypothetical protein
MPRARIVDIEPPGEGDLLTAESLEFRLVLLGKIYKFDASPFLVDPSDFRSGNLQRGSLIVWIELQGEVVAAEEGCN